jgi:hypothetical protein
MKMFLADDGDEASGSGAGTMFMNDTRVQGLHLAHRWRGRLQL